MTDAFHLSFRNGSIVLVKTSSNDPSEYHEAKEWVTKNKPGLLGKACEGIWEGGTLRMRVGENQRIKIVYRKQKIEVNKESA